MTTDPKILVTPPTAPLPSVPPKIIFASKTVVANALIAIAALLTPTIRDWVQAHALLTIQILTWLNVALRLVTKSRVYLWPSTDD